MYLPLLQGPSFMLSRIQSILLAFDWYYSSDMSASDDTGQRMLLRAVIRGRVHGVGFRYWVRAQATRLGLTGWVRNSYDADDVELEASGTHERLREFEELLWQGPALAQVTDVDATYSTEYAFFPGFEIAD